MRSSAEVALAGLLLASCAGSADRPRASIADSKWAVPRAEVADWPVKLGRPYQISGMTYVPADAVRLDETGWASWYGEELAGRATANGERFDPNSVSAAHRTLPLPSYVEVTAIDTGRTILVRVNDRGPFHSDRVLDLSLGAARQLGVSATGARPVRVRRVEPQEADKLLLRRGLAAPPRRGLRGAELAELRARAAWAAPAPRATALPQGQGPWFLQVASFISEDRARRLAGTLGGFVTEIAGTHRVRLGPFDDARRAQAALAPLAARGYPGAVITR
jgi:rare lipoprotein A